jgi:hypothetical protein
MFNILKKKTIELHCYTDNKMVYDCFKIQHGTNFYPQWWKDLPKYPKIPTHNTSLSMKGCYGFLKLYKNSFVIPLWSDLLISNKKNQVNIAYNNIENEPIKKILKFSNVIFKLEHHNIDQFKNLVDHNEWTQFKLATPWLIECKENINFLSIDCSYNKEKIFGDVILVPGMFNFFIENEPNVNGFVKNNTEDILLSAGTPLIHIVPLTERPIKIFCHLDPYKFDVLKSSQFFSFYNVGQNKLKQLLKVKDQKCPFTLK